MLVINVVFSHKLGFPRKSGFQGSLTEKIHSSSRISIGGVALVVALVVALEVALALVLVLVLAIAIYIYIERYIYIYIYTYTYT
jgi:hypothetical protein